jgi:hypothetical protein
MFYPRAPVPPQCLMGWMMPVLSCTLMGLGPRSALAAWSPMISANRGRGRESAPDSRRTSRVNRGRGPGTRRGASPPPGKSGTRTKVPSPSRANRGRGRGRGRDRNVRVRGGPTPRPCPRLRPSNEPNLTRPVAPWRLNRPRPTLGPRSCTGAQAPASQIPKCRWRATAPTGHRPGARPHPAAVGTRDLNLALPQLPGAL